MTSETGDVMAESPKKMKKTGWLIGLITLATAIIGGLFSMNSSEFYDTLVRPPLAPPSAVFPIVWGILYVAMAVSLVLYLNKNADDAKAFWLYAANLFLNAAWPLFFFTLQNVGAALFILVAMIAVNLFLLGKLKSEKLAFYLYLPYLLWQLFAFYLNLGVLLLN